MGVLGFSCGLLSFGIPLFLGPAEACAALFDFLGSFLGQFDLVVFTSLPFLETFLAALAWEATSPRHPASCVPVPPGLVWPLWVSWGLAPRPSQLVRLSWPSSRRQSHSNWGSWGSRGRSEEAVLL